MWRSLSLLITPCRSIDHSMSKYQIALVDDEALFRQGVAMMVGHDDRLEVCLSAEHGEDLLQQLRQMDALPEVLLCDLAMPVMDGVEVTKSMAREFPDVKVIILSSHYEPSLILKMLEIGASAFMPKNEKPEAFYETIINVIERGFHYNDYIVQLIREKMRYGTAKTAAPDAALSSRELDVLKLICEQMTTKEIGETLYISPRTVEGHRKNLIEKTGSKNTAGLIIYAVEHGHYAVKILDRWGGGE